jgi:hypothetical protein
MLANWHFTPLVAFLFKSKQIFIGHFGSDSARASLESRERFLDLERIRANENQFLSAIGT